ncbi:MAG: PAS domain S-box protein [Deltaproteobacteria bacterium]|nr:PAS domain S-box protein [Deltaproteobacteria bacterium]
MTQVAPGQLGFLDLNALGEDIRCLLHKKGTPQGQSRSLLSLVGKALGAAGGGLSLWKSGGKQVLCTTWGMNGSEARRFRGVTQEPPGCPGEALARVGWARVPARSGVDTGWKKLDLLVQEMARKQELAFWPLPWALGSGLVCFTLNNPKFWEEEFAEAVAHLMALGLHSMVLKSEAEYRSDDYRRIFHNSRDMIYLSSRDGRWERVNPAGVAMLGFSTERELLGVPDIAQASYFHPTDRVAFRREIERAGFVKDYEVTFKKQDGNPVEVSITAQVRREGSTIVGYEGIIKDITQRKEAERQNARQSRLLEAILEVMPVAVFVVDHQHRVTYWNRACEELTGVARKDIAGTDDAWRVFNRPPGVTLADVILDQDAKLLQQVYGNQKLRPSSMAQEAWEAEGHFPRLGGRPKDLYFTAALLQDEHGRKVGAVEAIVDTTQLKGLERQLAESEALYRTLVEANREGLALYSREACIFCNQAFRDAFHFEWLKEAPPDFLELIAPESRGNYLKWLKGLDSDRGQLEMFEGQGLREGQAFDIELVAATLTYQEAPAILFSVRDVSIRKQMEEQLIRSERLAATGKLAFDIAHEVNNPLGGILTYAYLLAEDLGEKNPVYPTLEKIIKLTNRCKIIVRGLLDFARQEGPEKKPMDVNKVVSEVLSLIDGHVILRGVEVNTNLAGNLPLVLGQRNKIEQVILNLVINAAEAMEGQGKLGLATRWDADKARVVITCQDDGPGMDEDTARRIFEPFFTTKSRGRGTGLGLAISHGIIQQHGGDIRLETKAGEGSTFVVSLPAGNEPLLPA